MNNSIITLFKTLKREFFYFPLSVVGGFELSRLPHSGENFFTMEWKDIPTFIWLYQVNEQGDVRSIYRYNKVLKWYIKKWYRVYTLFRDDKRHYMLWNRLLASAFHWLDLNNRKLFACHKNDIRDDNRKDNIFIWTAQDNIRDCVKKWRAVNNKWENNGMSKYTIEQIKIVKSLLSEYWNKQIEKMTWVNNKLISDIRHNKRWWWLTV